MGKRGFAYRLSARESDCLRAREVRSRGYFRNDLLLGRKRECLGIRVRKVDGLSQTIQNIQIGEVLLVGVGIGPAVRGDVHPFE